ncbi:MAG: Uncharacterised protein [Flavobacteriaceae bacterium]|nr:MAG: Uncharacterised protein [Flavobacteriaceae bacterium]
MSFYLENINFIQIKLNSEMKGLSYSERLVKYEELKDDVFVRLNNSYIKCNTKIKFYKDAFEVLGSYEAEYLVHNLFLEQNCVEIIDSLLRDNFFNNVYIYMQTTNSISYYFYNFIKSKSYFTDSDLVEFLKNNSIELTQTITEIDWINENSQSNPLVNKFSTFFITVDKNNIDMIIYGYYLFTKIWNHLDLFINPFNNTKGIILFHDLNKYLEENEYSNFYTFYEKLNEVSNLLFTEINYHPIIDKKIYVSYKGGYLKNRKCFWDFMELQKQRKIVSSKMSYFELISLMLKKDDDLLLIICEQKILKKIRNFEFPNKDEINKIETIVKHNDNEKNFLNKLYFY